MRQLPLSVLCLFTFVFFCGCGASGRATLFVDNDSEESVRVEIDGKEELYVGSGNYAKRFVVYGEHTITVKRNGRVIFHEKKMFEPHPDGPSWRHYLLDPDGDTRYAVREIEYFEDPDEAAKSKARRVMSLAKKNWVDIPKGATALTPTPMVFGASGRETEKRLSVWAD